MTTPILWHRIPEPVIDLFRRMKTVEHGNGPWRGTDVVDKVNAWLHDQGIAPETPADQIPEAEDPPHRYQRLVLVEVVSRWELDEDDLDEAVRGAVIGTGIRVEHADTCELAWTELDGVTVHRPGDLIATARAWARRRGSLANREDTDDPPTTSQLQASDDTAVEIASGLADLFRGMR